MLHDADLMAAVGQGDSRAFEEIVRRHQRAAWNVAWRFLGDAEEAEDVVQDAFLKLLDAAARYRPDAPFRSYLFRIVTRLCLDWARKKRPTYTDKLPDVADPAPTASEALMTEERARAARRALDSLPANQRMAVVLKYYEGMSYAGIAASIDVSAKAVERLLSRARETLQERLAGSL